MLKDKKHTDYSGFEMKDFLMDDFFIHSTRYPTPETEEFWTEYSRLYPENARELELSRFYMHSLEVKEELPSEETIEEMWQNIQEINQQNGRKRFGKLNIGLSIAASIAVIFSAFLFFMTKTQDVDLLTIAREHKHIASDSEEAQLIVAGDEVYSLDKTESTVIHNSTGILINEKEIEHHTEKQTEKQKELQFNHLIIPKGKRSSLMLADGTKIFVNAGTRVIYPVEFEAHKREIYVEGEIFLDVFPDKNRPFIVKTNDMDIEVLGTSFNVMAYDSEEKNQIVLVTGSVKVSNKAKKQFMLSPSDMFTGDSETGEIRQVDVEKYISWVNGYYTYQSERLELILKHISSYYGKEIYCEDTCGHLRISGKIDLKDDLDRVLRNFTLTAPTIYTKQDGKYIFSMNP